MTGFPLPYVVIVSDGHTIRTLHARSFGEDRPKLEAILARADLYQHLSQPPAPARVEPLREGPVRKGGVMGPSELPDRPPPPEPFRAAVEAPPLPATAAATMTQSEIARASGYTGDVCSNCHGFAMKRSGTCLTCDGCGSTSGGCS